MSRSRCTRCRESSEEKSLSDHTALETSWVIHPDGTRSLLNILDTKRGETIDADARRRWLAYAVTSPRLMLSFYLQRTGLGMIFGFRQDLSKGALYRPEKHWNLGW